MNTRIWANAWILMQNSFIPLQQATTVGEFADKIGAVRALLSGADDETPLIAADGTPSLVTADANAIAYSRTPQVRSFDPDTTCLKTETKSMTKLS